MAISLSSIKSGVSKLPPIAIIYGDGGIGKTSFGANAPDPVFIFTENSLGRLDVPRFSFNGEKEEDRIVASSYDEVMESLNTLLTTDHHYNTVVIDTLDWMEPLIWAYLIRQQPTTESGKQVTNIETYGYGKGYKFALDYWKDFLDMLGALRSRKDMMVILIAHHTKEKVVPPDGVAYDAYTLKLQNSEKTSAKDKVVEYADIVLFANWRTATTEEKMSADGKKTRNRGIGSGERIIYTEQRPAYEAKNRYSLPEEIRVMDDQWRDVWQILANHIPWFQKFIDPATQPQVASAVESNQV